MPQWAEGGPTRGLAAFTPLFATAAAVRSGRLRPGWAAPYVMMFVGFAFALSVLQASAIALTTDRPYSPSLHRLALACFLATPYFLVLYLRPMVLSAYDSQPSVVRRLVRSEHERRALIDVTLMLMFRRGLLLPAAFVVALAGSQIPANSDHSYIAGAAAGLLGGFIASVLLVELFVARQARVAILLRMLDVFSFRQYPQADGVDFVSTAERVDPSHAWRRNTGLLMIELDRTINQMGRMLGGPAHPIIQLILHRRSQIIASMADVSSVAPVQPQSIRKALIDIYVILIGPAHLDYYDRLSRRIGVDQAVELMALPRRRARFDRILGSARAALGPVDSTVRTLLGWAILVAAFLAAYQARDLGPLKDVVK